MSVVSPSRRAALAALIRFGEGAAVDAALRSALSRFPMADARDRALATELTYGTVRQLRRIDYTLQPFVSRPLPQVDEALRMILRLAAYQGMWLHRVPPHAVVHQAVEQAKSVGGRRTGNFVNGVLRAFLRGWRAVSLPDPVSQPIRHLGVAYSHPDWLVRNILRHFSEEETRALLAVNNEPPPVTLRVNRLRATPQQVRERLEEVGVRVEPGRYLPEALRIRAQTLPSELPGFAEGWFTPQDEASILVARLVAPLPGEVVIDACAAPGTKATHLAEIMNDQGNVLAFDIDAQRLAEVQKGARRLGLKTLHTSCLDARKAGNVMRSGMADRVLLDAPCSGLGTLARRPDLRWRKRPDDISSLAALQRELLEGVAGLVRPGGVLVYSTCTITPEENELVVDAFLRRHPEFRLALPADMLPEAVASQARNGRIQLWPHRHGTDGFFIARMERIAAEGGRIA